MKSKEIEIGPFTIKIDYNPINNEINVDVLDELGEIIECINIKDDDDEESEDEAPLGDFNLN